MLATIVSILGYVTPFALAFLNFIIQNSSNAAEAQAAFLAMTKAMAGAGLISVNLHDSYAAQVKSGADTAAQQYDKEHPKT